MVRIGKVQAEGRPDRSGPSFSEVQITGLTQGSSFPIITNDPVIDDFSCLFDAVTQRSLHVNVERRYDT